MKPLVRTQALSASAADLVFKALADRGRRRLLDRLRVRGGQTLNELCDGMDMSR
jgi:DNA-binding transcriptional ArsR family regulator